MVVQFDIKTFTEYCFDDETHQPYGVSNPFGLDIMDDDFEVDLIAEELTHPRIFSYVKPYVLYNGEKYVIKPKYIKVMGKKHRMVETIHSPIETVIDGIYDILNDETKSIIMFAPTQTVIWSTNSLHPVKTHWSFHYAEITGETY